VAIIAAFHSTGATYGTKKRRWLLRIPSAHADSTSTPAIGNRIRVTVMASSRRSSVKPGRKTPTRTGASATPTKVSTPASASRSAKMAPATRPASR
jgi:hypothetical protein